MNIRIKESAENIKKEFRKEPEKVYEMYYFNVPIGYGTINKDNENLLTVYVKEEYRGKGYGKKMFHHLLKNAMDMGYEDVNIIVENENVPMIKILEDVHGFESAKNSEITKYVIHVGSPFDGVFDCE